MPQLATRLADPAGTGALRGAAVPVAAAAPALGWEAVATLVQLFARRVARTPEALGAVDLTRGTRVAILLANGWKAVCLDQTVLARGPNVLRGCWKRAKYSARSFIEHWRIRILDRIKEIIVTSTGEKIAPREPRIGQHGRSGLRIGLCFRGRAAVHRLRGRLRGRAGRLLLEKAAAARGLDPKDPASVRDRGVRPAVLERVRDLTRAFSRAAQPRAALPMLEAWTIENSLLTPTLKLKRNNLAAHFAQPIKPLYQR